jgi:hypothetical protein
MEVKDGTYVVGPLILRLPSSPDELSGEFQAFAEREGMPLPMQAFFAGVAMGLQVVELKIAALAAKVAELEKGRKK